ncbi:MAG: YqaJ viral recombinase family protein [Hydrogenophaga sp.]|nr:YqaJ viral recombinase family protein [Hydrogenophaga sp.]
MNLNDIPTPVIVQLQQGSPEWLAYRCAKRNASESAAVMGASPWMTPYQLWLAKTGRQETTVTPAMQRGTDLEPLARAAYEEQTGLVMQPLVLEAGEYSASLDGMTLEGDLVLEIKCPVRGTRSDLWQDALAGQVPMHYRIQVQHQLMVSGAQTAHLWVFDGTRGVLVSIDRDEALMDAIRAAWDGFQPHLNADTPPVLSDADTRVRTDQAWQEAAQRYAELKRQSDAVADQLEQARQALVALAEHPKESGAGVTVSRYWKQGAVDYKKIPVLQGLDMRPFRGRARQEVRVSVE